ALPGALVPSGSREAKADGAPLRTSSMPAGASGGAGSLHHQPSLLHPMEHAVLHESSVFGSVEPEGPHDESEIDDESDREPEEDDAGGGGGGGGPSVNTGAAGLGAAAQTPLSPKTPRRGAVIAMKQEPWGRWSMADATVLKVRGPTYLLDHIKVR